MLLNDTNQYVVWLDVSMSESFGMQKV